MTTGNNARERSLMPANQGSTSSRDGAILTTMRIEIDRDTLRRLREQAAAERRPTGDQAAVILTRGLSEENPPRARAGTVVVDLPRPVMSALIRLAVREDRDVVGQARRIITEALKRERLLEDESAE